MTGDRVSRRGEIHWNDELCSVLERGSVKKRTLRTAHADHESAAALSAVIFRLGPSALDQPAAVLLLLCWTRRVSPTYINLTWLRQCLEWNIRVLRLYDVLLGSTDACNMQHFSLFVHQTDLEKFGITSFAHLCSEWVPSEWESKQLIKTSQ